MIPRWLVDKRSDTCRRCEQTATCQDKFLLLYHDPPCSLDKLPPLADELIWAKAWPQDVAAISGCCDRAD